MAYEQPDV